MIVSASSANASPWAAPGESFVPSPELSTTSAVIDVTAGSVGATYMNTTNASCAADVNCPRSQNWGVGQVPTVVIAPSGVAPGAEAVTVTWLMVMVLSPLTWTG